MASSWIKIEVITPDKPEIYRISEILDIDPDAVLGKLVRIWAWADQQTVDGNAECNAISVTKIAIDRIAFITGFADALIRVGWLKMYDDVLTFPNFDRHNGNSSKKRAVTNRRVTQHREKKRKRNAKCNADSVTESEHEAYQNALPEEEEDIDLKDKRLLAHSEQNPNGQTKKNKYPDEFEALWREYPKRQGGNPKPKAFSCWNARLREGVTHDDLLAGVRRYRNYIDLTGKAGTEFVMQAQRFLGAGREFENSWQINQGVNHGIPGESLAEQQLRAGREQWLREQQSRHGSVEAVGPDGQNLREPLDHEEREPPE